MVNCRPGPSRPVMRGSLLRLGVGSRGRGRSKLSFKCIHAVTTAHGHESFVTQGLIGVHNLFQCGSDTTQTGVRAGAHVSHSGGRTHVTIRAQRCRNGVSLIARWVSVMCDRHYVGHALAVKCRSRPPTHEHPDPSLKPNRSAWNLTHLLCYYTV